MVVDILFSRHISCPYFQHASTMHVLAIDSGHGRIH